MRGRSGAVRSTARVSSGQAADSAGARAAAAGPVHGGAVSSPAGPRADERARDAQDRPITGGRFAGPALNGEILDNGADWQVVGADGATVVDTRYLLRLDDGALAYLRTQGFRHGPPDVLARITQGEVVDPTLYYFRVQMLFETASGTYDCLNRTLAIGSALRTADAVVYDAYRVT